MTPADKNAQLPEATAIELAELCGFRPVLHIFITTDAAAFALALDALNHDGIASVSRVKPGPFPPSTCFQLQAKGMDPGAATDLKAWLQDVQAFL